MNRSIIASFENSRAANAAVDGLLASGYKDQDISLLVTDKSKGQHFEMESNSKAPEGAATGATVGGALGALAAGLSGITAVAATGGTILASGPIVAALAGAGAGGTAGGLIGGLIGLGVPEQEAKLSNDDLEKGSILVAVATNDNKVDETKESLKTFGASNIVVQKESK